MSENIIVPSKTVNTPFTGQGIYIGIVRQVADKQVYVEVPLISPGFIFGPCLVVSNKVTTSTTSSSGYLTSVTVSNAAPSVGEKVVCAFLNGERSEIIVLGRILS